MYCSHLNVFTEIISYYKTKHDPRLNKQTTIFLGGRVNQNNQDINKVLLFRLLVWNLQVLSYIWKLIIFGNFLISLITSLKHMWHTIMMFGFF